VVKLTLAQVSETGTVTWQFMCLSSGMMLLMTE